MKFFSFLSMYFLCTCTCVYDYHNFCVYIYNMYMYEWVSYYFLCLKLIYASSVANTFISFYVDLLFPFCKR